MKKIFLITIFILSFKAFSQLGIGTNTPHSSAMLDITSTNKGFLPPRMTGAQRDAIVSPVAGLEIWCIDCGSTAPYGEAQIYNGTIWTNLVGGTIKSVTVPGTNTSGGAISPIGIGTNTPAASAALEINSTSKGFLVPRMTSTERNRMEPASTAAGLQVWCSDCNAGAGELSIFNGVQWTNSNGVLANLAPPSGATAICDGTRPTVVKDVSFTYNGVTYTWMDRNLGASRVATVYNDFMAYGCMYQWGRGNDGHASMNWTSSTAGSLVNGTTTTKSSTLLPGNALFITNTDGRDTPNDWMTTTPSPDVRWRTLTGNNNPCPSGYRLPNHEENLAVIQANGTAFTNATSWGSGLLKLPVNGALNANGSTFFNTGTGVNTFGVRDTYFPGHLVSSNVVYGSTNGNPNRSMAKGVRCIKSTTNGY
jgi:hypothetical protein